MEPFIWAARFLIEKDCTLMEPALLSRPNELAKIKSSCQGAEAKVKNWDLGGCDPDSDLGGGGRWELVSICPRLLKIGRRAACKYVPSPKVII